MAVAYKGAGTGVATEANGGNLNPTCPATVDAGDILIAHVGYEGTATTPSTPDGWTLLTASGYAIETNAAMHWIFGKIAVGNEDGAAISFGTPAVTTMRTGRIYSFSGRTSGTILQCVPTASFAHLSNATDPAFPNVTTTTIGALAVACIYQMDDNGLVSATGESGGDWTEAVAEYMQTATTPDSQLGLQTCTPTANPGTVTGGTISTANDPVGVIGFQIIGNFAPTVVLTTPTDAATGQSVTPTLIFTGTDPDADEVEYEVQVDTSVGFDSQPSPIDFNLKYVDLWLAKTASPTDNLFLDIRITSFSGVSQGQSNAVVSSGVSASPGGYIRFTFATPITITGLAKYYMTISRSGARDTTNYCSLGEQNVGGASVYSGGGLSQDNSGTWNAEGVVDGRFIIYNESTVAQITQDLNSGLTWRIQGSTGTAQQIGQGFTGLGTTGPLLDILSSTESPTHFLDYPDSGDTHPFTQNTAISYAVQAGILTAGLTYYWRARAIDPAGTNTWGAYPTKFSFQTAAGGGGSSYGQTCTAEIVLVDVIIRQPGKLASEILSIADLIFRFPQRIISNAVVLADTSPKSTSRILPVETLTLADILTSIKITIKEFLEMIFLSDVAVKATQTIKTEMVVISDATIKAASRALAETLVLADKIITQPARILTEILALTETITRSAARVVGDTIGLADTAIKSIVRTLASESLALADIIAKAPGKVLAEMLTVSDGIVRTAARILTETISLIDIAAKATSRALADAIALSDFLAAIKITLKEFIETITMTDTITRSIGAVRTDILALTDVATRSVSRAVVDTISLLDNAAKATSRALTEQMTLGDIFSGIKVTAKTLIEVITLNDTISKTTSRISAEVLALADTIKRSTSRAFQDALSLTDNALKSIARVMVAETMNLADTLARATTRVLTQSISITDAAVKQTSRTFSDIVTLGDNIARAIGKTLIEAISLIDTVIASIIGGGASYFLTLADRITASDSITRAISKVATETITLVDSISRGIVMVLERLILYLFGRAKTALLPRRSFAAYLPVRAADAFQEARSFVLYKNKSVLT